MPSGIIPRRQIQREERIVRQPQSNFQFLPEFARLDAMYHILRVLEIKCEHGLASWAEQEQFQEGKAEYDSLYDSIAASGQRESLETEVTRLRAELAEAKRQSQPGLLTRLLNPKPNGNGNGHAPAEPPASWEPQADANWRREIWPTLPEERRRRFMESGY